MTEQSKKRYVGDGVYIDHDGYSFVLTTEDGVKATNTIYFEPSVWKQLLTCGAEIEAELKAELEEETDERKRADIDDILGNP